MVTKKMIFLGIITMFGVNFIQGLTVKNVANHPITFYIQRVTRPNRAGIAIIERHEKLVPDTHLASKTQITTAAIPETEGSYYEIIAASTDEKIHGGSATVTSHNRTATILLDSDEPDYLAIELDQAEPAKALAHAHAGPALAPKAAEKAIPSAAKVAGAESVAAQQLKKQYPHLAQLIAARAGRAYSPLAALADASTENQRLTAIDTILARVNGTKYSSPAIKAATIDEAKKLLQDELKLGRLDQVEFDLNIERLTE